MSAVLMGLGAGIYLFLGLAHGLFTIQSKPTGGPMMPTDPAVLDAMQRTGGLGMAPGIESNLYRAWIGFNLSHSLGIVVIAGLVLWLTIDDVGAALGQPWFVAIIVAVPVIYFALAQLYWFDQPRNMIALATALLWGGALVQLAA